MISSKISVPYFCHQVTTLLLPLQMRSEEPPSASFSQSFISPPPPCLLVPFYPLVRSESRFLFCSSRRLLLLTCLSPCSPSCPFCALLKAASSFPLFLFCSSKNFLLLFLALILYLTPSSLWLFNSSEVHFLDLNHFPPPRGHKEYPQPQCSNPIILHLFYKMTFVVEIYIPFRKHRSKIVCNQTFSSRASLIFSWGTN